MNRESESIQRRSLGNASLLGPHPCRERAEAWVQPRWGWGSANKPMGTCLLGSAQSWHGPGQAEGEMKSGPRETTTRPAHGKMGPGEKVRRAVEAQGEERPLGPGWSGTASWER